MNRYRRAIVLAVAITCGALAGCAPVGTGPSATPTGQPDSSTTVAEIAVYDVPADWGSNAGAAEGVLVAVDGCVMLDNGRVPVFPREQTRWNGETLQFGNESYRLGDPITFAGNELGEGDLQEIHIPDGCSAGPFWIVGPRRG